MGLLDTFDTRPEKLLAYMVQHEKVFFLSKFNIKQRKHTVLISLSLITQI